MSTTDPSENIGYLWAKAQKYLERGPIKYRERDGLNRPRQELDTGTLALVMDGMKQILAGHGFSEDNPFTALGIDGCYALMDTLHFEPEMQSLQDFDLDAGWILDKLVMRHCVSGSPVIVYNRVFTVTDEEATE